MAAARADQLSRSGAKRLASSLALALLSAGCAGGIDPGYSVVTHDRYAFMECPQIIGERNNWTGKEKQLRELTEQAESSPGGIIVGVAAYRTELAQARTQLRLAQEAAQNKGCDAKKP